MQAKLFLNRCNNSITVGWQFGTLLPAFRLLIPELAVIDLAFYSLFRLYAQSLAIDFDVLRQLALQLYPKDVKYGIDVRYLRICLSLKEHEVIELY